MAMNRSAELLSVIQKGDTTALARAITLIESTHPEHRKDALQLVGAAAHEKTNSLRVAISGIPGSGKSTLIDVLGMKFVERSSRVAVLAVDPSSPLSGGSILGDKTRMDRLSAHPSAFVRPSPSGGVPGGVARNTREAIMLCEAAGYDIIFVETVGVGQAELAVHDMVDIFILLTITGAGDELQGIKRGILELADIVAVTKADADNVDSAESARSGLRGTIGLLPATRTGWQRRILTVSATTGSGIDKLAETILEMAEMIRSSGQLDDLRRHQLLGWFDDTVTHLVNERVRGSEEYAALKRQIETEQDSNPAELAAAFVNRFVR